jgi:alpha-glucosidase
MLSLTRSLIALRRREPALSIGDWKPLAVDDGTLAFMRTLQDRRVVVALDLSSKAKTVALPGATGGRIQFSTNPERSGETVQGDIQLGADEALVIAAAP